MASIYLAKLSTNDRISLIEKLHNSQNGNCFICGKSIDLNLHRDTKELSQNNIYNLNDFLGKIL